MNHPAGTDRPQMEGTITCPHCGQVLAEACRVCVSCKQVIDAEAIRLSQIAAPAAILPAPEPPLPPARFSWPIFFLTLGAAWLAGLLAYVFGGLASEQLLLFGLFVGSSLWVIWDAQARRIPKPWRWGAASLLLWIVFFPWYASRRRTPKAPCPFVEADRSRLPLLLVAVLLLQFLLAALIATKQGPAAFPLH